MMIEFSKTHTWFNSSPLSFDKELKGKIVLLYLWNFSSAKNFKAFEEIERLQKKFASTPFVVLAVHSPKFPYEKNDAALSEYLISHQLKLPVVQDHEVELQEELRKTFTLVGPEGNVIGTYTNEEQIEEALQKFAGELDPAPLTLLPLPAASFRPTRLAYDEMEKRLFIASSAQNKILVTDREGKLLEEIGSGAKGSLDGSFTKASFHQPHGLFFRNHLLYIADTGNGKLRVADMRTGKVKTLLSDLTAPLDLTWHEGSLLISDPGSHQIFEYRTDHAELLSGSGVEENWNSKQKESVAWAEPAGLTTRFSQLFVADSSSSTIRWLDLRSGAVHALVGGDESDPENLHAFGDQDGTGPEVKLQCPLSVVWIEKDGVLVAADTYNHVLKQIDAPHKTCKRWLDGFKEPQGMLLIDDSLLIADAGNHRVVEIDLDTEERKVLALGI